MIVMQLFWLDLVRLLNARGPLQLYFLLLLQSKQNKIQSHLQNLAKKTLYSKKFYIHQTFKI